jgi:hypothetical protein
VSQVSIETSRGETGLALMGTETSHVRRHSLKGIPPPPWLYDVDSKQSKIQPRISHQTRKAQERHIAHWNLLLQQTRGGTDQLFSH